VGRSRLRLDLLRCAPREANRGRQRTQGRDDEYHPERGVESVHPGPRDEDRRNGSHADGAPDLAHGFDEPGRQAGHRVRDTGQSADLYGRSSHSPGHAS